LNIAATIQHPASYDYDTYMLTAVQKRRKITAATKVEFGASITRLRMTAAPF